MNEILIQLSELVSKSDKVPLDLQVKTLWAFVTAIAADVEQLKDYHNADKQALIHKLELLANSTSDFSALADKLNADIDSWAKKLG